MGQDMGNHVGVWGHPATEALQGMKAGSWHAGKESTSASAFSQFSLLLLSLFLLKVFLPQPPQYHRKPHPL